MTLDELLERLQALDIQLRVEGDRLRVNAPPGALTPALQSEIVQRKSELIAFLSAAQGLKKGRPAFRPVDGTQPQPLSIGQERILALAQLLPEAPLYNMYLAFRLFGPLDEQALESSLAEIVRRQDILRTRFEAKDGVPVQIAAPYAGWALTVREASAVFGEGAGRDADRLAAWATAEASRPFDLAEGALLRVSLLRSAPDEALLVLAMHHLAADGWSWEIFLRDLAALYAGRRAGQAAALPDLLIQYASYAAWQREFSVGEKLAAQIEHWKTVLRPPLAELRLPAEPRAGQVEPYQGRRQELRLPAELSAQVRGLAAGLGSTLFVTLLAAFQALLYQYSGQTDLLVCTPVANRSQPELNDLIGYFNNLLVIRTGLEENPSFRELVERARGQVMQAFENQEAPYHLLAEQPEFRRISLARAVFAVQGEAGRTLNLDGLRVVPLEVYTGTANFDLFLTVTDSGGPLTCTLEYKQGLFSDETVDCLLQDYRLLLQSVVSGPDQRINSFALEGNGTARWASSATNPDGAAGEPAYVAPRNEREARLARLWEEVFSSGPISVTADFFALGGHSLLALNLFRRIEKEMGITLPLTALLQSATIAGLAAWMEEQAAPTHWEALAPIQPYGSRRPFFGVHGITGQVLFWRNIVQHLPPDQPFYALQARGIDGLQPARTRIEDMARAYIAELRQVQPHGPYHLGGYSLGGEVAFEMARQLAVQDEPVALVVLFDTANPSRPVRSAAAAPALQGGSGQPQPRRRKASTLYAKVTNHLQRLAKRSWKERVGYVLSDVGMRAGRLALFGAVRVYRVLKQRLPNRLRDRYVHECHMKAVMNYIPEPYPGRITLFRSRESLARSPVDDPLGWGPLAEGGVQMYLFESSHQLVNPAYAKKVAAQLEACLAEAQAISAREAGDYSPQH